MIYLSSFRLSEVRNRNPNIYPYNVFSEKEMEPFIFAAITVLYGDNGSGKSTILNILANKLQLKGKECANNNRYGIVDYCGKFSAECSYSLGDDENGIVMWILIIYFNCNFIMQSISYSFYKSAKQTDGITDSPIKIQFNQQLSGYGYNLDIDSDKIIIFFGGSNYIAYNSVAKYGGIYRFV